MKRVPQKSIINEPETIIIKVDPAELKNGIVVPKVKYEVQATLEYEQVFHGMVLPIPRVLVYYLNHIELQIVSIIIEETNENAFCELTVRGIATRLKVSTPTVSNALWSLRRAGLLLERVSGNSGQSRLRKINYETVQHLNDLVEGEDPGVYGRIRKATRKIDISNMTKDDIREAYDNKVLEPGYDPIEAEEYD